MKHNVIKKIALTGLLGLGMALESTAAPNWPLSQKILGWFNTNLPTIYWPENSGSPKINPGKYYQYFKANFNSLSKKEAGIVLGTAALTCASIWGICRYQAHRQVVAEKQAAEQKRLDDEATILRERQQREVLYEMMKYATSISGAAFDRETFLRNYDLQSCGNNTELYKKHKTWFDSEIAKAKQKRHEAQEAKQRQLEQSKRIRRERIAVAKFSNKANLNRVLLLRKYEYNSCGTPIADDITLDDIRQDLNLQ